MTTYTFERFLQEVISKMEAMLGDYEIVENNIIKMNDNILHGVTARLSGDCAAPTVYLDTAYDSYLNGESLEDISKALADTIKFAPPAPIKEAATMDMSFESIKDRLAVRLIDMELNHKYLKDHPFREVGAGLAIIAVISIGDFYSCVITNSLAEQYDMDTIFDTALENMTRRHPAKLMSLASAVFESGGNALNGDGEIGEANTLMVDGSDRFGACAIAYEGIAEKVRAVLGTDYFILPSSLHELIIVKDNGFTDIDSLKDMVVTANKTVVEEADLLSNSVFHYGTDGLSRVA